MLAANHEPAAAADGIAVATTVAVARDVPIYLTGLGSVQAYKSVAVRPRVDGELSKVAFVEGQRVHAGDVLAEIDPKPLKAQLAQVEAAEARDEALLANAKLDLKRFEDLMSRQFATKQSVDTQHALIAQYEASVRNDQAQVDYARIQLGYATIISPINGITGIRHIDEGNIVHAGESTTLVTITQLQPITVVFSLPQDELPAVKAKLKSGRVSVEAYNRDQTRHLASGELSLIDNQIDQSTAMIRLKAVFPNEDEGLWPGEFVMAKLLLEIRPLAIVVPSTAVQQGPEGQYLYVVDADHKAVMRPLSSVEQIGTEAIVQGAVAAGDIVVIEGQFKLEPGAKVAPVAR